MIQKYSFVRFCIVAVLLLVFFSGFASAATVSVGSIAPDFTLRKHGTSNWVHLRDYAGEVIVLDFFAYWCGPCHTASSQLEPYVQQYFNARGGNDYGVPVRLISISVDNQYPQYVDDYINTYGLELVLDGTSLDSHSTIRT